MAQVGTLERLISVSQVRVAGSGLGIDPNCAYELDKLIQDAAQHLDTVRAAPQVIDDASANLELLIDAMADVARGRGAQVMHEWSLGDARARLCPLFPFC